MQERVVAGNRPIKSEAQYLAIDVRQGFPIRNGRGVISNRPPQFPIRTYMQIVRAMMRVLQLIPFHEDDFTREIDSVVLYREPGKLCMFV